MNPEQKEFWKPYIDLIGVENFTLIKGQDGMIDLVQSKHYCGMDTSSLGKHGEANRTVAINRYHLYQETLSKGTLSADDIDTIFLSYIDKAYFDTELIFLLTKRCSSLSLDEYWDLVVSLWCRQEFTTGGSRGENWKIIFNHRERPDYLTKDLPDTFTAYRAGEESGYSWTLDKKVADWFHNRFKEDFGDIPLLKRNFKKSDAVFYTNSRNEKEVVIISNT
ncbi:MAG: hypothetical protein B7X47_09020 [Ferrovum sp. 34-44-207]|nr:MAG: hypothetical protein B7X47_09020 [Ferrovum sp. 34-44-207]